MSTSSGNGDSTLSPTKGSSTDKPLDDDHVEELLARRVSKRGREDGVEVFSESEIEVVSQRRGESAMHEAPRRDYSLEEEIHRQYPEWTNGSVVTYAFSCFTFPRRPVAFVSELGSFSGSSLSDLKYDHSERGRQVRREQVRSRRKIAKVHIPRLVLPDLVEEWACADLRQTRKVFIAAHRLADDFEEIEFAHWISPPPFDAAAISLADEPPEGNYNDWLASLVDGCLLRREEAFEAGLKEQLELIGQKKMWDRLRTEPAPPAVFALDITTIKFFFFPTPISLHPSMSTTPRYPTFFTRFFTSPPTRDDPLKRQELKRDSELPRGEIRSFVTHAVTDKHWQITLIGRIVAVVQEQEERYLVLEALPGEEMLQDFQEMVWALERLKDRTAQSSHTKCANSWTRPGLDGFDSGFIYVHITSRTQLTTHACERGEPWIVEPPFTPVDPLAVGAAVYCVAYLLQIDNMVHDEPLISSKQWIVKCRFLSRLHLPSAGARAQNPAMLVFLSRGGVPGRPLAASQALPARDETDDAEE
ncbi:hypothetical protein C8F01DRAFT_1259033 [Mycena amicta]|nr:hypothetical protein C8F01DRAFT_1259033 [Mycena amicta]